jgi:3-deoxy-D-manno-octulosonic-acid transferase
MTLTEDRFGAAYSRLYSILWYPALPIVLAVAGGDAQSRRERLGGAPCGADKASDRRTRVWLHAASVGEIEGVRPVVRGLTHIRPELDFVITTMTPAGRDAARQRLNGISQLAPFDHTTAVRTFIERVRPALLVITETELWPNFFLQSAVAGVKIALINARLSTRSVRRYRFIRPLIARALRSAHVVLAQTTGDAERFCYLGAPPERIVVSGNAKYEIVDSQPLRPGLAGFAQGRPILVAGSTAPGEEQIVLTAYFRLLERFPALALVLAPRHLQRIHEIESMLRTAGPTYVRATDLSSLAPLSEPSNEVSPGYTSHSPVGENAPPLSDQNPTSWGLLRRPEATADEEVRVRGHSKFNPQVLLLDTMGELGPLYRRATIAFVGGSLRRGRGGQSLAEPATASVPILFGPHYENHQQLGDALIAAESGQVVRDAMQLADAGAKWLADGPARSGAGRRARSVIEQLAGSTTTIVRYLCALLPVS